MADTQINVGIRTDITDFRSALDELNTALGNTKIKTEDLKKPVGELFQIMESSSDKAVAGLIKGTETWHKAMITVIQDLEIKFAQLVTNKLLSEIATNVLGLKIEDDTNTAKVASAQTRNAAIVASDQEASGASIASQAEKAIASIFNDAKQVFGGIFAFLAPEMGPAAAGPAAAGSATVAALASGIAYAEAGAWSIPSNTLAYLHAGEMVVPQSFASQLRGDSSFGSGGDSYSITIQAIDSQTGAQFLKNNAAAIASALSGQARNFSRHAPAWR